MAKSFSVSPDDSDPEWPWRDISLLPLLLECGCVMKRLPVIVAAGVLLVAASTTLLFWLRPSWAFFLGIDPVDEILGRLFREQTDRLILLAWWFIAIMLAFLSAWSLRREVPRESTQVSRNLIGILPLVLAIMILVWSTTWAADSHNAWPGIPVVGLGLGALVALGSILIWRSRAPVSTATTVGMVSLILAVAIPVFLQGPSSLIDGYHFTFIADEIAAPAAGKFPLSDYIPQYVTLLGWPIAPMLGWLGANALWGVIIWLVILQVLAFGTAIRWVVFVAGWRFIAPAMALIIGPSLTVSDSFNGAISYFQTTPARIVLPVLALYLVYRILEGPIVNTRILVRRSITVGLVLGIAVLNNPDYGVPAMGAAWLAVILFLRPRSAAVSFIFFQSIASFSVFVSYSLIGLLAGRSVDWSHWVIFQVVYGAQGHAWEEPIRPFGLHIGVVALFISATIVGTGLSRLWIRDGRLWAKRQGLLLTLVGAWSLLSLPYFVGRSLTPTLVGGYAFMIGLTAAAFLPSVRQAVKSLMLSDTPSLSGIYAAVLSLAAVVLVGSVWSLAPSPSASFDRVIAGNSAWVQEQANGGVLSKVFSEPVSEGTFQAIPMASLVSLQTGVQSGLVASNPLHISTDPVFASAQCRWLGEQEWTGIWVDDTTVKSLRASPDCLPVINLDRPTRVVGGVGLYVPVR